MSETSLAPVQPINLGDIYRARKNLFGAKSLDSGKTPDIGKSLNGAVMRTPLVRSLSLSDTLGYDISYKLETMQPTGAFKLRGAANRLLNLTEAERACGVVAVSSGNHGRGLSLAGRALGIRVVVCMGRMAPQVKVDGIRAFGAEARIVGDNYDEAEAEALRLVRDEGLIPVSPFDETDVIAGQGTIGLELLDDAPDLQTVIVPLSGGGLIGGIAIAVKTLAPHVRIVGVSMDRGAAMHESIKAGKVVPVIEEETLADALGGGIGKENFHSFGLVRDLVDDIILVSEEQIADAMRHLYWTDQLIVEGAGAVGVAALRAGLVEDCVGPVAVVLSGRNVDMDVFSKLVATKLST